MEDNSSVIFDEIYGEYYNAVAEVLRLATEKPVTINDLRHIASSVAFSETSAVIEEKLKANGDWPLIDGDGYSVLEDKPMMPLTKLQMRWLKALLLDPRIKLFGVSETGLKDTKINPLYHPDVFVYYDQNIDGDPFEDENYIRNFKTVLLAIRENRRIQFGYTLKSGEIKTKECNPYRLEYSLKDDKFRLISTTNSTVATYNMAKMVSCELSDTFNLEQMTEDVHKKREVILLLKDERQALERAMLQFSNYEKTIERINDDNYRFVLRYETEDEIEIIIRVLSFGPNLKVIEPEGFINQIKQRISNQKSCGL